MSGATRSPRPPAINMAPPPTGVDDRAALQRAHDSLPASGGEIMLRSGTYVCPTGQLEFTKPCKLVGTGTSHPQVAGGSMISTPSENDLLTVDSHGFEIEGVGLVNTASAPTAGTGLRFTQGRYVRVGAGTAVSGFFDGVRWDAGYYYSVDQAVVVDNVRYGVYLTHAAKPDYGDQIISNSMLGGLASATKTGVAAVCWESGGGLKFVGNKINSLIEPNIVSVLTNGLLIQPADGVTTSVFVIAGNSIESTAGNAIEIKQKGPSNTGAISKIAITGNEFGIITGAVCSIVATAGTFDAVVFDANVIGQAGNGLVVGGVAGLNVGTNTWKGVGTRIIDILTPCTDYRIAPQVVMGDAKLLIDDRQLVNPGHGPYAQSRHSFEREIPTTTSNSTYTTLYRLALPNFAYAKMKVTLAGNLSGVGGFFYETEVTAARGNGGSLTLATIGTPLASGGAIDVLLDTATAAGEVQVKVRRNGANGTDVAGYCAVEFVGPLRSAKKGP